MTVRDALELLALALVISAVAVATVAVWPTMIATAAACGYLAYVWDWDDQEPEA